MKRRLFKTLVAVLAIAAAAAGPVRGQNSNPDVTLDFTSGGWNIPTSLTKPTGSYTNGTYSITLSGANYGYKLNSDYLLFGKNDAYLQLPAFSSPVEKIEVVGKNTASGSVMQNIYVGETAVSTQTKGAKETNTYVIAENYRAAGNIYTLKVESAHNTQITYIKVYYVSSGGGSGSEPPTPGQNATTYTVAGSNAAMFGSPWDASYTANDMTMNGDGTYSITYTNVYLDDDVQYKVVKDHSWNEAYPDGNRVINIAEAGTYTVTIHFNPTTHEVYEAMPTPHTVRFAAGNDGWTVQDVTASASATAPAVLQNVMAGDSLVVTAPATLPGKVKSVKAVKYVPPAATVTTAPTATAAIIEAGSTAALVNAGTANGGTMMYAVTTTNAQPASTADFSATRPTAEGRTAGTYYVWYYAKADAEHSDSEIAGPVSVTLAEVTTLTWNSTNVFNSAHEDDAILNNEWHSNPLTYEGVTISMSAFSEESVSSFTAYKEYDQAGSLTCFGEDGDSFTFTAPSGKMFCKIEIIDNVGISFDEYGDWTSPDGTKIVWSGTAASTVTLGTVYTSAGNLNSIVFKMIDAQ